MTISEYKNRLESYTGTCSVPADFHEFWEKKMLRTPASVCVEAVPFTNPVAIYETISITVDKAAVKARCIRPAREGSHPLVLMFHDLSRGVRGWHHMTRFIAQGYGVLALDTAICSDEWKHDPPAIGFERFITEALILTAYARKQDWVDTKRIVTWGEGLGGGLSIAAAALIPEDVRCCALNPMPADLASLCSAPSPTLAYCDICAFAPYVTGKALIGVCLMDTVAPPEGQYAVYNRMRCEKKMKVYPKYIHERVNAFENELLAFLHN